jgi:CDP-diacylglycerol--glycerol-3-phosphate 3-phosphatidyltransferase
MGLVFFLTLVRILLGPLFLFVYLNYEALGIPLLYLPYLLILILGASELSDLFDGILARKRGQVTELGKIVDPMADSIFRITVFLAFTQGIIQLPLLAVCIFLYRDAIISTLRTVCALRGVALAARLSGKIKAIFIALVALSILILMIPYTLGMMELATLQKTAFYVVLTAGIYTLISAAEYLIANRSYIEKALKSSSSQHSS